MSILLRQDETTECGLVCLAFASQMLGAEISIAELRRKYQISSRGLSLREVKDIAASMHMLGRAVRCELTEIADLTAPSILHWSMNHFVVFQWIKGSKICIYDPAIGKQILDLAEFSKHFTGVALELSASPDFQKRKERSPLSIWSWFRLTPSMYVGLFQTLIFSLLLQTYVVAFPFYLQLAIDQAALKGDRDLLVALTLGFAAFAVFKAGADFFRGIITAKLTALLSWDMTLRLFRHLIRLPLPWFQRRKLADVLSRFDSIAPLRDLVSGALVSTVVDGILAIVTLVMMIIFSPQLSLVVVAGFIAYVGLRYLSLPFNQKLGMSVLTAKIAENGKRIESIRAIQTIKVMGAESDREGDWSNKFAATLSAEQRQSIFNLSFKAIHDIVDSFVYLAIVFLGVIAIIEKKMSIGVLYAFMSYQSQFLGRMGDLFEQVVRWRLTDMYSFRVADIVLTPKEQGLDELRFEQISIDGSIQLDNLYFAYAPQEPNILSGISLSIDRGDFVAIVGASGSGKSTLLKILCGLYRPTYGEVKIDGRSLSSWGPKEVRKSLGIVLQDDELLSGTIAENISFFDEMINVELVWECLHSVGLAAEIQKMPMRIETYIGDMGSNVSGGQKQRLLLARALYRKPQILVLDEATSHLDMEKESLINESIKRLQITRIIVAHRRETIEAANRVIGIENGKISFDKRKSDSPISAEKLHVV